MEGKISGISHITFVCKNLERSAKMFEDLFGAKQVYSSDGENYSISNEKFFLIGDLWIALMEGDSVDKTYNNIAFQIHEEEIGVFKEKISSLGLDILHGRQRVAAEAESLYFYDYDNHLFELYTGTLEKRLSFYKDRL